MTKRTAVLLSSIILATVIAFTGCKKLVHENIKAASNNSLAVIVFNDVFKQLNRALSSDVPLDEITSTSWNLYGSVCADVSLNLTGPDFPKVLTIDYGDGCVGADGITRKGKIIAVFSGNFDSEDTGINVSFDGYTRGQYAVSGTDSLTNMGTNGNGNPVFSELIENVNIGWSGQQVKWDAELERTWTEGYETNYTTLDSAGNELENAGLNDDMFEVTGTAVGNDSNTHPYTMEITEAVVLPTYCEFITQGMVLISPANFNDGTVDYGQGECDKQAIIEVDGEVFNFTQ